MPDPAQSSPPPARASHTHTVEVGREALVVDHATRTIHRLDPAAAAVWERLDGRGVERVIEELTETGAHDGAAVRAGVEAAVAGLHGAGLLDTPSDPVTPGSWEVVGGGGVDVVTGDTIEVIADGLLRDVAALELDSRLRARGIPTILLKGPSFALWLYRRGERTYVDIDLLVPPEAVDEASDVLAASGFEPEGPGPLPGDRWTHAVPWRRARDDVGIDLHTFLVGIGASPSDQWRILAAHREPLQLLGLPIDVLDEPGRLVHLALHLAQDDLQRAKKLRDLERALEVATRDAWAAAATLAEELGAAEAMGVGLRATPAGDQLAADLRLPVVTDTMLELRSREHASAEVRVLRVLRAGSLRDVVRYAARMAVPPRGYLVHWSPFEVRGRFQLALLYLYRLVYVVGKGTAALPRVIATGRRIRRDPGRSSP